MTHRHRRSFPQDVHISSSWRSNISRLFRIGFACHRKHPHCYNSPQDPAHRHRRSFPQGVLLSLSQRDNISLLCRACFALYTAFPADYIICPSHIHPPFCPERNNTISDSRQPRWHWCSHSDLPRTMHNHTASTNRYFWCRKGHIFSRIFSLSLQRCRC